MQYQRSSNEFASIFELYCRSENKKTRVISIQKEFDSVFKKTCFKSILYIQYQRSSNDIASIYELYCRPENEKHELFQCYNFISCVENVFIENCIKSTFMQYQRSSNIIASNSSCTVDLKMKNMIYFNVSIYFSFCMNMSYTLLVKIFTCRLMFCLKSLDGLKQTNYHSQESLDE